MKEYRVERTVVETVTLQDETATAARQRAWKGEGLMVHRTVVALEVTETKPVA